MCLRCLSLCVCLFMSIGMLTGCEREKRDFPKPVDGAIQDTQRWSSIQPAQARETKQDLAPIKQSDDYYKKYEGNGYAVSQGKRLYSWYNCSGCHAAGGGGIGPALMDDKWLYGGQPTDIYNTIAQGRPKGMPSFAGHIPEDQLWQLVAYVRSMSGQLRTDVAPNRNDSLSTYKPESQREKEPIKNNNPEKGE